MRMKDYFAARIETELPQNLTEADYQEMLKADPDYEDWLIQQADHDAWLDAYDKEIGEQDDSK